MLFAGIAAADLLGFEAISGIIAMFIAFGSQIILGAVILTIGFGLQASSQVWLSVLNKVQNS